MSGPARFCKQAPSVKIQVMICFLNNVGGGGAPNTHAPIACSSLWI
jgi:hypothetical protein